MDVLKSRNHDATNPNEKGKIGNNILKNILSQLCMLIVLREANDRNKSPVEYQSSKNAIAEV